ncbi:MAG: aldo/keto reductase [Acidobacteria bacterium]|nr:aldo/keto reductase [Acidobacteriota bacterium]
MHTQTPRREFMRTAAGAAGAAVLAGNAPSLPAPDARKTRSYNENMEYRPLGRTGLMISAISIGGHWKRIPFKTSSEDFRKNRRAVMNACLDHGINYVDACSAGEVMVYAEAVKDRREEVFMGFDWTMGRDPEIAGSLERMKQGLDEGLRKSGLDYVDLWRVTLREQTTQNSEREIETVMAALDWGKKTGKARFTGIATHHRPWIAAAVAKYSQIEVVVTPYSAGSKEKPAGSMFDALRKLNVGMIGIKPFASGNLFASRGTPDSPTRQDDDQRARMALRYVLCCDVLSASIPGLITVEQVKNAAAAVRERRQFESAEVARYEKLTAGMWQRLPDDYSWLRSWEWV